MFWPPGENSLEVSIPLGPAHWSHMIWWWPVSKFKLNFCNTFWLVFSGHHSSNHGSPTLARGIIEGHAMVAMYKFVMRWFQVMCVQYWPAGKNKEEAYSGVGVTVENEEQLANFMIRTIRLRKVRNTHNLLDKSAAGWCSSMLCTKTNRLENQSLVPYIGLNKVIGLWNCLYNLLV